MAGKSPSESLQHRARILVLDADNVFRRHAVSLLEQVGYSVAEARLGNDAVDIVRSEPIDLLITDFSLPDTTGLYVVSAVQNKPWAPQCIVTCASRDLKACVGSFQAGADDFLIKPINPQDFLERVGRSVKHRYEMQRLRRRVSELENPGGLRPEQPRLQLTVLFTDVRGFARLSEDCDPETAVAVLNGIFAELVQCVQHYQGYVDNFMGDGMMAVFADATEMFDHALRALRSAHLMHRRMVAFHDTSPLAADKPLEIGIGVHTGNVVCGPIGAGPRQKVTIIGDTVNIASRLCDIACGGEIMISDATYAHIADFVENLETRQVVLRGKKSSLTLHRVCLRPEAVG